MQYDILVAHQRQTPPLQADSMAPRLTPLILNTPTALPAAPQEVNYSHGDGIYHQADLKEAVL